MNGAKFTPGPWNLTQQATWPFNLNIDEIGLTADRYAYSTEHKTLDDVMDAKGFGGNKQECVEANARQVADFALIAAAPDLVAALIKIMDHFGEGDKSLAKLAEDWKSLALEMGDAARAALAKAGIQ